VFSSIRNLIEKIVLRPTGRYAPIDIEVHGHLPGLLRGSEQTTTDQQSGGVVVAGARNHCESNFLAVAI
jgi:hypothetical protein